MNIANQPIDPKQSERAEFIGQDRGIAMPHSETGTAAFAWRAFPISANMPDNAKQLRHGRRVRERFLQPLAPESRVAANAVELRRKLRRDLLRQRAAGKR